MVVLIFLFTKGTFQYLRTVWVIYRQNIQYTYTRFAFTSLDNEEIKHKLSGISMIWRKLGKLQNHTQSAIDNTECSNNAGISPIQQ